MTVEPWTCRNCRAVIKSGVVCPLCRSELCPACDGDGGALYFNGETEDVGPCAECSGEGFIPVDWAEAA